MNRKTTVKELKKSFCKEQKLKVTSVKLLLDGRRLNDRETVRNLPFGGGCVIEAFIEQKAGGWVPKRNVHKDEMEILEELERSDCDPEGTDTNSSSENEGCKEFENQEKDLKTKKEPNKNLMQVTEVSISNSTDVIGKISKHNLENMAKTSCVEEINTNTMEVPTPEEESAFDIIKYMNTAIAVKELEPDVNLGEKVPQEKSKFAGKEVPIESTSPEPSKSKKEESVVQTTSLETIKRNRTILWLEELRKQGNFERKNPIDKKILFLLAQPNLVEVEINMLKS